MFLNGLILRFLCEVYPYQRCVFSLSVRSFKQVLHMGSTDVYAKGGNSATGPCVLQYQCLGLLCTSDCGCADDA